MVDLTIAGRTYQVACREGEEENLASRGAAGRRQEPRSARRTRHACREARQFLFASLLLADQLIDKKPEAAAAAAAATARPGVVARAEALAERLELLADGA